MKNPNPQGKGLVPALELWNSTQPAAVAVRSPAELLADYCLASLVLAARFDFKPVPGNDYYLYWRDERWQLSLIAPDEWGDRQPGVFAATCHLRPDMTWRLAAADDLNEHDALLQSLRRHVAGFMATLEAADSVTETLPHYARNLPFYPRLFAAGLARSLSGSLKVSGLDTMSGSQLLLHGGAAELVLLRAEP